MATTITGTNAADVITVVESDVTVNAGAGNDTITIASGSRNVIHGDAGDDTIVVNKNAGTGNKIYGDTGDDTINAQESINAVTIYGGDGVDKLYGGAGKDTLQGGAGNDELYGGAGDDTLLGGADDDILNGGDGNDSLNGGTGNDTMTGGVGSDTFVHYQTHGNTTVTDYTAGEDVIQIASGAISGTEIVNGTDVKFTVGSGSVTVKNGTNQAISLVDKNSSYTVFAGNGKLKGGAGVDKLYGGDGEDTLQGGAGNDELYGGAGDDTLLGGADDDILNGGDGDDSLNGGTGNDTMTGGAGSDTFVHYQTHGNTTVTDYTAGEDVIQIASGSINGTEIVNNTDVKFTVGSGSVTVQNGVGKAISLVDKNSSYTVFAGNGKLKGGAGVDKLYGGDGEDTLQGGAGNDELYGGAGDDTLLGGADDDILNGGDGDDSLNGGTGNDTMTGGAGSDTFVHYQTHGNTTVTDYTAGEDVIQIASGSINGTEVVAGNDVKFTVGSGSVTVKNGTNQVISLEDSRGSYTVSARSIVLGSDFTGTMSASKYLSTLTVIDGSVATSGVTLKGNGNNNVLKGGSGDDTLYGSAGNDMLYGNNGNDTFVFDKHYKGNNSICDYEEGKDVVRFADDMQITGFAYNTETNNAIALDLNTGGTINISSVYGKTIALKDQNDSDSVIAIGTSNNDSLSGTSGDDILYGDSGRDTLSGGAGNDVLYGGDSNDTLTGGLGNDTFVYESGTDTVTDYTNNSTETDIVRIEGTAISNVGHSGNTFVLLTSNDTGTKGQVWLTDALGKPVKIEDNHGLYSVTRIQSDYGWTNTLTIGDDFSDSSNSFDASDLTFASVIDASAMTKNITITGRADGSIISTGQGDDTLIGGAGGDTLTGGSGNDIFVYDSGTDTITDYTNNENETDILRIESTTISDVWESTANNIIVDTSNNGRVRLLDAAGKSVKIEDNHGAYTISGISTNPTIILGSHDSDGIFDASDLTFAKVIDASGMEDNITVTGNTKDNVIYAGKAGSIITGGAGSDTFICSTGHHDTITDYANNTEEKDVLRIEGSSVGSATVENGSNVKLAFVGGSVTLNGAVDKVVKVEDARGNYSISKLAATPTITLGSDYTGSAFDASGLAFVQTIDAADTTQAVAITGNANNNVIYAGGRYSDALTGGTGSDTYVVTQKLASDAVLTINQGDNGVGDTDILQFQKINKEDVRYSLQDNVLTIMHSSGGTISVTDWYTNPLTSVIFADGSMSNEQINACLPSHSDQPVTQQSVIKSFMRSLDDATKIAGTSTSVKSALDVALTFASNFAYTSWDNLVRAFKNDITTYAKMEEGHNSDWLNIENSATHQIVNTIVEPGIDRFLKDYCGIVLLYDDDYLYYENGELNYNNLLNGNNVALQFDTGAITGSDAGGSTIKTAESIVPENGKLANMITATPGGTTTINGLTFHWPEVDSDAKQTMINALNTWWAKEGLDLIEESYGMSFYEEDVSARDIEVMFVEPTNPSYDTNLLAFVTYLPDDDGVNTNLTLNINMKYYNEISDENGATESDTTSEYLDRTIAHELTHAVMAANITGFANLPKCIKEGSAELVHGIDDVRAGSILTLTNLGIVGTTTYRDKDGNIIKQLPTSQDRSERLDEALKLNTDSNDTYAAGYMLLHYFAKQVADYWNGASSNQMSGMLASSGTDSITSVLDVTPSAMDGNASASVLDMASSVTDSVASPLDLASVQVAMLDFADHPYISDSFSGIQQEESKNDSLFITGNV